MGISYVNLPFIQHCAGFYRKYKTTWWPQIITHDKARSPRGRESDMLVIVKQLESQADT